jgi:hypothetical protein
MNNITKRERRAKWVFAAGFTLLVANFFFSIVSTRLIKVDCAYCKKRITNISYLEHTFGPWKDIPCLHPGCHDYIANFLAPNSSMTIGQWLEIRGWNPRSEETRGKTWKEIIEKDKPNP